MSEAFTQLVDIEDEAAFIAAVEQGLKSLEEGRSIPLEDVRRWVLSWGTENELPPPECR